MSDSGVFLRLSLVLGGSIIYLSDLGIHNIMTLYVFFKESLMICIPLPLSL